MVIQVRLYMGIIWKENGRGVIGVSVGEWKGGRGIGGV